MQTNVRAPVLSLEEKLSILTTAYANRLSSEFFVPNTSDPDAYCCLWDGVDHFVLVRFGPEDTDDRYKRLQVLRAIFASPNVQDVDIRYGLHYGDKLEWRMAFFQMFFEVMEEMSSSQTLRLLRIEYYATSGIGICNFGDNAMRALGRMLSANSSLNCLELHGIKFVTSAQATYVAEGLAKNCTLRELKLQLATLENGALNELLKPLTGDALGHQSNTSLNSLRFSYCKIGSEGVPAVASMLRRNNSLITLAMWEDNSFHAVDVLDLLSALKTNVALKNLDLRYCPAVAGKEVLAAFMDLLEVNHHLQTINLDGTGLEKNGADTIVSYMLKANSKKVKNAILDMNTEAGTSVNCGDHKAELKRREPIPIEGPKEKEKELKLMCAICMDTMKMETSTVCGHIFCQSCIHGATEAQKKCPTCRRKLVMEDIHRIYIESSADS